MAIKLGLTDIADVKLGTTQVDKIYLGSTEVWSNSVPEDPTSWAGIQQIVKNGHANTYFTVGDEINVSCPWVDPNGGATYSWIWVVADIGTTYKESNPNTAVPAMTLIAKYTTQTSRRFDAGELLAADEATAQANVYYYGYDGTAYTKLSLSTGDTIPYSDYTTVYKNSVDIPPAYGYNIRYGYNNWKYSNIRQWLNSTASGNNWFTSTHVGDMAPNYSSQAGFLRGFSSDFLDVLTPTRSSTVANSATDGGVTYYTYDKMFLPSAYEMNLANSPSDEGPVFSLYNNASSASKIKYRIDNPSTAVNYQLRSNLGGVESVLQVNTSGARTSDNATNNCRIAPACRIC